MPSPTVIKVQCDPYLIRFLEKLYGPAPITFPKNSTFNSILEHFLDKPPLDFHEPDYGARTLQIRLPYLEHRNVVSNCYLSELRQRILVGELKRYFKITFRTEISKLIVMGLQRQDSIEVFIEKYGLTLDSWDMLEKDYQRYLKLRSYHKQFRPKKNLSDKEADCPAISSV